MLIYGKWIVFNQESGEDMSELSLAQAVRNVIEAEKASEKFYLSLKEYSDDDDAKAFFDEMAEMEREHIRMIETVWNDIGQGDLPEKADRDMSFVETVSIWKDAVDINYKEALVVAKDAENQALLYYDALSDSFQGEVKNLFATLAKQEEGHAKRLEKRIADYAANT